VAAVIVQAMLTTGEDTPTSSEGIAKGKQFPLRTK
jgi:hypothetical protein